MNSLIPLNRHEASMLNTIRARLRGVSFDNRQAVIASLGSGDPIMLTRDADNPHDHKAVQATAADSSTIGYLARQLTAKVGPVLDDCGKPLPATIVTLRAFGIPGTPLGVEIAFDLPSPEIMAIQPPLHSQYREDAVNVRKTQECLADYEWTHSFIVAQRFLLCVSVA